MTKYSLDVLLFLFGASLLFHVPCRRSGAAAERSNPMSKEQQLHRCRRAERSYSTFKVKMGDLVQGKEQRLRFAGAAMKRYPTSKVRETQVKR